ncbi:DNA-directed RNA polymerase III subunit RPC7-like [Strongylocentrotus purpuratus]|uniref:DNA-directed RNA polymerase III subunit n=1 Tax=Strongylocentrotus purpuratus TaxID=7668 RepID=A0A7M7GFR8_STRPU|nr:DNA-directed RNA polymerase III subunit RPC7-like [Strongylocentrotus purpuratus]
MAGRGRGRGRGRGSSFAADALGLGRGGEALPPPTAQPPPLFPPLEFSPAPLPKNEEDNYMYLLKQEFRGHMRDSPYCIKPHNKKKDIERYSDKYQVGSGDNGIGWHPDWKRFPKELRIVSRKARPPKSAGSVKPSLSTARVSKKINEEVIKKLDELEKKEDGTKSGEEEEEEEEGQEEEDAEEYYDEEEQEEGTDYISNYFDPGEDYIDEDDGGDDGPTY